MVFRDERGKLYHIGAAAGEVANRVLLPGSRVRVKKIAEFLSDARVIHDGRFLLVTGEYRGIPVSAIDTGIGPSSAAIVVREVLEAIDLSQGDAILIRPGTCGALQPWVNVGDLIVSTGVVAQDGVTPKVAGERFPLFTDPGVVEALVEAATRIGYQPGDGLHVGVTHAKDALYEVEEAPAAAEPWRAERYLEYLQRMGVLATEMELGTILAISAQYNARLVREGKAQRIRVGGVFLSVSPVKGAEEETQFHKPSEEGLIRTALDALVLAEEYRPKWLAYR